MTTFETRFAYINIDDELQTELNELDATTDIDDELLAELNALECLAEKDHEKVVFVPSPKTKKKGKSIEFTGLKNAVHSVIFDNKDEFGDDEGDDEEEDSSISASSDCASTLSCSESEEIRESNKRTHDLGHTVREFVKNSERQATISKAGRTIAQLL